MKYRIRMIADGHILRQATVDFPTAKAAENEVYSGVLEPGVPADPLLQARSGKPIKWVEMELAR